MSHVNALYHIVFETQDRKMTITNDYRKDLYRFIWKIITDRKCKLIRIDGIPNHIHILLDLHPTVALAELMREIKAKSSGWMKKDSRFSNFEGWRKEYFAASVSYANRDSIIEYIKGQQLHHSFQNFTEEFHHMLTTEGMEITEFDS